MVTDVGINGVNGNGYNGVDDYDSPALYRPRYSVEESSEDAYEKDQKHRRCVGRKSRVIIFLLFISFIIVVRIVARIYLFFDGLTGGNEHRKFSTRNETKAKSSIWPWKKHRSKWDGDFTRAKSNSDNFFNTISNEDWKRMKADTRVIIDEQKGIMDRTEYLLSESGANINSNQWWTTNWKINFTCQKKVHIGGRWICDPTRIISMAYEKAKENKKPVTKKSRGRFKRGKQDDVQQGKECLIYVSGGRDLEFGHQFLDYSMARMIELHSDDGPMTTDKLPCEVHVFTLNSQGAEKSRDGMVIHNWGFRPSNKESMGLAGDGSTTVAFKTLEQTITELQHSGRVEVLALDCDACEWDMYPDLLALKEPIRQVSMQMHGTPYMANELFLHLQEAGYVIFNREATPGNAEVYDYSWLRLAPLFFNWKG